MKKMRCPDGVNDWLDGVGVVQVYLMELDCISARHPQSLTRISALRAAKNVHPVPLGDKVWHHLPADEAASTRQKHRSLSHPYALRIPTLKSGYCASRSDITTGTRGHEMEKCGSSQRMPRASAGLWISDII